MSVSRPSILSPFAGLLNSPLCIALLVSLLLSVHFVLGVASLRQKAPTADEYSYIATGYLYWQSGDYRLDRTHPPLMRFIIGAPLYFSGITIDMPSLQKELWDTPESYTLGYRIGWEMLLGGENDWQSILFLSRLPVMLLSCLLGLLLFFWGAELYGKGGGLIALFFYTLSPTVMAHARLATMDSGVSFFFVLTLYCAYRFWRSGGVRYLMAMGVALGLTLAAKVTGLVLLPVLLSAAVWCGWKEYCGREKRGWLSALGSPLIVLAATLFTLCLVYQWPLKPFYYLDTLNNVITKSLGLQLPGTTVPGMPHQNHAFYLMGAYSTSGWPWYFLAAIAFKTPIAVFLSIPVWLCFAKKRWLGFADVLLLGTIALLLLASAFNQVNIGVRHVLPFYPLLHLYLGRLWQLSAIPYGKLILIVLALMYGNAVLSVHPHYIPYFNELCGGPERGHLYLDDSNLDWGQDFSRLQAVQQQYPESKMYVATNWMFHDEAFGIEADLLSDEQISSPPAGIIAVGKHWTIRHQINRRSPDYFDWLERFEPIGHVGHSMWLFDFRENTP